MVRKQIRNIKKNNSKWHIRDSGILKDIFSKKKKRALYMPSNTVFIIGRIISLR